MPWWCVFCIVSGRSCIRMSTSLARLGKFSWIIPWEVLPCCLHFLLSQEYQQFVGLVALHNPIFLKGCSFLNFLFSFLSDYVSLKDQSSSSEILSSAWSSWLLTHPNEFCGPLVNCLYFHKFYLFCKNICL